MRILVLESTPGLANDAERELADAGHELVRCHEPGASSFPCTEVAAPGSCPLQTPGGVDCVVVVHGIASEPAAAEAGVTCALRQGIPVVADHEGSTNPFAGWTTPVDERGVAVACDLAVAAGHARETRPLIEEIERLLAVSGMTDAEVAVRIERGAGRTRIAVAVPPDSPVPAGHIATRVHARYGAGRRRAGESVVDVQVRPV